MCGYCNEYYGVLNNYFGLGLFCKVLQWRSILEDMILESWVSGLLDILETSIRTREV